MGNEAAIFGYSGGKDSTGLGFYLLEHGVEAQAVFADTGNELQETIDYIQYINDNFFPIITVKADFTAQIARKRVYVQTKWREEDVSETIIENALSVLQPTGIPFLDLCIWKGRFPSTTQAFCSYELKVAPTFEQIVMPLIDDGYCVTSYTGKRADESRSRENSPVWTVEQISIENTPLASDSGIIPDGEVVRSGSDYFIRTKNPALIVCNPILDWTAQDVFDIAKRHGCKPNPLYKEGARRVGCAPCINAVKDEISLLASRYPAEIERLREWERLVSLASKCGTATFFMPEKAGAGRGMNTIDEVVTWSKTSRGGNFFDMFKQVEAMEAPVCTSIYGLCE